MIKVINNNGISRQSVSFFQKSTVSWYLATFFPAGLHNTSPAVCMQKWPIKKNLAIRSHWKCSKNEPLWLPRALLLKPAKYLFLWTGRLALIFRRQAQERDLLILASFQYQCDGRLRSNGKVPYIIYLHREPIRHQQVTSLVKGCILVSCF